MAGLASAGPAITFRTKERAMRLKANDTMFVSSVKSDNILPGEEFEVSDEAGRQFVEHGLATEVGKSVDKTEKKPADAKADAPPLNKMDAPPRNKAGKSSKRKGK